MCSTNPDFPVQSGVDTKKRGDERTIRLRLSGSLFYIHLRAQKDKTPFLSQPQVRPECKLCLLYGEALHFARKAEPAPKTEGKPYMPAMFEIRADFDERTIVVYQAYSPEIALPAVERQKFVPPFSFQRMTWIKPSFLWLMERSQWGQRSGQEHTLAIRITRSGWEEALRSAVLTAPEAGVFRDPEDWRKRFEEAPVHVQWDPERSLRGAKLPYRSIQVGLSRKVIRKYVEEWIVEIKDYTPLVKKLRVLRQEGRYEKAAALLPRERVYPLPEEIARRLGMG